MKTETKITEKQQNLLDEYIVLIKDEEEDNNVTLRSNFEKKNLCETYANYGQKVGCENAGCYAIDNSYSDCKADFEDAFEKHFQKKITGFSLGDLCYDNEEGYYVEMTEKEVVFLRKWQEENEAHSECIAWNYWDGRNFKTIVLKNDNSGYLEYTEADDEQSMQILKAYKKANFENGSQGYKVASKNGWGFTKSAWADNPWIFTAAKI